MSHSKRNTSRAVFTSYEREQAKRAWGATSARLSRESMLPFSACGLCLEPAEDPVSCSHGDVFCRECALSNILAQKKEIKRLEKARELEERNKDEEAERRDQEAREREVVEFERVLSALGDDRRRAIAAKEVVESDSNGQQRPGKRKFEIDADEVARIASEDRAKARKALDEETAIKNNPKLPSFWLPSITPSSNTKDTLHEVVKKTKTAPVCPGSREENPHTYALATLVTVHFTEEEDEKTQRKQRICPSCKKVLNNSSKATLAKPCGHVVCRSCVDRFIRPRGHHDPHAEEADKEGLRCYVCDADLVDRSSKDKVEKGDKSLKKKDKEKIRPGLVEMRSEGTGFSAGGKNEVKKNGVAFQC